MLVEPSLMIRAPSKRRVSSIKLVVSNFLYFSVGFFGLIALFILTLGAVRMRSRKWFEKNEQSSIEKPDISKERDYKSPGMRELKQGGGGGGNGDGGSGGGSGSRRGRGGGGKEKEISLS